MNKPIVRRGNVYKIAFVAGRKNAKRHLYKTFQAETVDEAAEKFEQICSDLITNFPEYKYKTFTLCTGNWKTISEYKMED